jgi:excinuclease ABC subunit A
MTTNTEALAYYSRPGVMSDPGGHLHLLDGLPASIPELCAVVQGLLLHPFDTRLYDLELTSVQRKEINIRPVSEMLARLHAMDERPLGIPRPPQDRLVGVCRDFALLLCTMLRYQGVPARIRVGFAGYFRPPMNYDHWVTEYWAKEENRWIQVEPQIGPEQRGALAIEFDPFDLPADKFYTAGRAWQLCRSKQARSVFFGHTTRQRGFPYIRRSLLQDLAALNKVEVLPWDMWWELGTKPDEALTPDEKKFLDRLAGLTTGGDELFHPLRAAYEDDAQFTGPVRSRLMVLGLVEGLPPGHTPELLPSTSERLAALTSRVGDPSGSKVPLPTPATLIAETLTTAAPPFGAKPGSARLDPASIVVRGAQQHNLKRIDVTIPRYQLVVLTGVSGSGKSSLAFDTLYAEGQRRYVESLSAYVRRYMDQMDKPKVDFIAGLSPAIAIEQKSISKNPRSTVGTVTEVLDYLRVLYARAGTQHCPACGRAIEPLSPQQIADRLAALPAGTRFQLHAPLPLDRKGDAESSLRRALQDGFTRARVDGLPVDLSQGTPALEKNQAHSVDLIVDRLQIPVDQGPSGLIDFRVRLIDSVETALRAGKGMLSVELVAGSRTGQENGAVEPDEELLFSEHNACPSCGISLPQLTASLFSFNAPTGMCPDCNGLGTRLEVDPALIIEHPELSLLDGASRWYGNIRKKKSSKYWLGNLQTIAGHYGVDLNLPWRDLPETFQNVILNGSGDEKLHFTFESENEDSTWRGESVRPVKGIIFHVKRLFRQTKSDSTRRYYASFMSQQPCPTCQGTRLCAEARFVTVGGATLPQVTAFTIEQAYRWVLSLLAGSASKTDGRFSSTGEPPAEPLSLEQREVVGEVLKELHDRLQFMLNVGLHYLTLDRPAPTLSGGEGQRIRLASQLGCGLVGVLYILDEPSIGLHARDQRNLLDTLQQLRDMGNTVLVVEHDAETMRAADWLIDLGPGAGVLGGEVVSSGTPEQIAADPRSLTGRYLSGELRVTAPNQEMRREPQGWLEVRGARLFNLKSIDARFPLGVMTCVTGVSGSGKSSLVAETLFPALTRDLHGAQTTPGPHDRITGLEQLDKVINITQDPIGRTPRSNPATYVKVFDEIRRVFASTPEARLRGYKPERFSFNLKGGRCEACQGHGQKKIEMHFLPDVWITCQECKGARYNRHTLEVAYKGKNIAEVLDMDVQQAMQFFGNYPAIARVLQTLHEVGLDYVKLGQSATTLSGGEAQRVKLAKELSRIATGRTLYILDEPTTGLHFIDIQRLLDVLHRLVDAGNTVIVVEHNLDVIRTADWLLDLGPEGGEAGGYIVAEGTPERVALNEASYTGRFLREVLDVAGEPF